MPHVICYLDDILVTSVDKKKHLGNLEEVLRRLLEHGVTLKREKCSFFQDSLEHLCRVIDAKAVWEISGRQVAMASEMTHQATSFFVAGAKWETSPLSA